MSSRSLKTRDNSTCSCFDNLPFKLYEYLMTSLLTYYLSRLTLVGKALSFTHELSFFLSFLFFSSRAVDGHQMYFRGSVVGKASTVGIEISPTPPLIFTGGDQKVRNLASFKTSLKITENH